jgi:RIO-like serine/threonine protein kinase
MAVPSFGSHIAPESLRLMLLAYGINHAYRVVSIEDISHALPHLRIDEVKNELNKLARDGFVTRFSGRYCFNKSIPRELQQTIEQLITPSGTIRKTVN